MVIQPNFPDSPFGKNAKGKFGVRSICKECTRAYHKTLRLERPDLTRSASKRYKENNKDKVAEARKLYYLRNKTKKKEERQKRYEENKDHELARNKLWAKSNKQKVLEIGRVSDLKRRSTPKGKLDNAISGGVHRGLTKGSKMGRRTFSILGYSLEALMVHLERLFAPGMTWENYGDWHVDHVIPRSAFNYQTPDDIDFKRAWSLSNLQPLWAKENMSKSDKILKPFQPSLALSIPLSSPPPHLTNL